VNEERVAEHEGDPLARAQIRQPVPRVQIDPAIVSVLSGVESHRPSSCAVSRLLFPAIESYSSE
jgi:hypothetical protein